MPKPKRRFVRSRTFNCPSQHKQKDAFMKKKHKQGLEPWWESYTTPKTNISKDVIYYYSRKKKKRTKKKR